MWEENDSQTFIDYGNYYVPGRETQFQIIRDLIAFQSSPPLILELGCGEGLLAETLLAHIPTCRVHAYDGSVTMLRLARKRLVAFGDRFQAQTFNLTDKSWRRPHWQPHIVVSSLVIHHLDGEQKRELFGDIFQLLAPGGMFIVADLILPTHQAGLNVAAKAWDLSVRRQSIKIDGDEKGFEQFVGDKWNFYRYPDPVDQPSSLLGQLKWLEEAGFVEVDVHWFEAGHAIFSGRK